MPETASPGAIADQDLAQTLSVARGAQSTSEFKATLDQLRRSSSLPAFISTVAQVYKGEPHEAWRLLGEEEWLQVPSHAVDTVGVYYFKINRGGAEKVTADLARMWAARGKKVVVFTDENPSLDDYLTPDEFPRVVLPADDIAARMTALAQAIDQYGVDAFVSCNWLGPTLPWDMMLCKGTGVPFVAHAHSTVRTVFFDANPLIFALEVVFRYVDGLVVLTRADEEYWSATVPRVWRTINAVPPVSPRDERKAPGSTIVWVGRLAEFDKQPSKALRVMAEMKKRQPQATLVMVGADALGNIPTALTELAEQLGISDSVQFVGWQEDTAAYYAAADVQLITSRFEGFGLMLAEGMAAGLPSVMFSMPYLELVQNNDGAVQVPHDDYVSAAMAIGEIVQDPERAARMGAAAQARIAELNGFDRAAQWDEIFAALAQGSASRAQVRANDVLRDMLFDSHMDSLEYAEWKLWKQWRDHEEAMGYIKEERDALRSLVAERNAEIEAIHASATWKVGTAGTFLPRKLKSALRKSNR